MRLIYKATQQPVAIGDAVTVHDQSFKVDYFTKPHKPDSEGKVTVLAHGSERPHGTEFFVSVIGAEWIEREDREPPLWVVDLSSSGGMGVSVTLRGIDAPTSEAAEEKARSMMKVPAFWHCTGIDRDRC